MATFQVSFSDMFGNLQTHNLRENGDQIPVTLGNKQVLMYTCILYMYVMYSQCTSRINAVYMYIVLGMHINMYKFTMSYLPVFVCFCTCCCTCVLLCQEYVDEYTEWLLNKSIASHFDAFKTGFDLAMGQSNLADLFRPEELEMMVCGSNVSSGLSQWGNKAGSQYNAQSLLYTCTCTCTSRLHQLHSILL